MQHRNATLVEHLYAAYARGDIAWIESNLSSDVVIHVPGRNPLAGDYHGHAGFREFAAKNQQLARDFVIELQGVLADDERAVTFEHLTAHRNGTSLDVRDSTVFRFEDGKIAEMTLLTSDPYAHDRFWS